MSFLFLKLLEQDIQTLLLQNQTYHLTKRMHSEQPNPVVSSLGHAINPHPPKSHLFNPNWQQAQKHGKASRVGFIHSSDNSEAKQQRCYCCFEYIEKQQIPLNQNTKQLQFLGFGFPLYYAFVRNCIFLLLVTICSYNVISIYQSVYQTLIMCQKLDSQHSLHHLDILQNYQKINDKFDHQFQTFELRHFHEKPHENNKLGNEAQTQEQSKPLQCSSFFVLIARTQKKVQFYQQLLRAGSFFIHLILLIYIRDKLIKLKQYFDERTTSLSDYSLMITNLPQTKNLRHQLSTKIKTQYHSTLVEIILIPDLKEFEALEQKKNKLVEKLRSKWIQKKDNQQQLHHDKQYEQIHHQLQLTELYIEKFIIRQKDNYVNDQLQAVLGIMILNTEPQMTELLAKFRSKKLQGKAWEETQITQAPEPKQIIWQNIFLSQKKKASLTCFGWFLSLLLLVALTVVFAIVSKHKSHMIEQRMHEYRHGKQHNFRYFFEALLLVFGMIFFVVLFNKLVMSNLFHKFTDLQRHSSTYKFQFSFCLKYCLGLFFTTALMTLLVEALMIGNYYKQDYGVVQQQTIMFLVNSFFVPIFWAIHPTYLFNRFNKWRKYGQKHFTQKQANHIMQLPEYDVGKRYAEVLEIMWFTYLYITLIPIGGVISCIGIVIYYWVDKYNLLRRSCMRSSVSGGLIHLTLNMLDFTLVLRMVGELLFDYQTRDGMRFSSWVCLAIALIYQIIPVESIISIFNNQKFKAQRTPYSVARKEFKNTYYDEHILFSMLKQDRDNLINILVNKLALKKVKNSILEVTRLA